MGVKDGCEPSSEYERCVSEDDGSAYKYVFCACRPIKSEHPGSPETRQPVPALSTGQPALPGVALRTSASAGAFKSSPQGAVGVTSPGEAKPSKNLTSGTSAPVGTKRPLGLGNLSWLPPRKKKVVESSSVKAVPALSPGLEIVDLASSPSLPGSPPLAYVLEIILCPNQCF